MPELFAFGTAEVINWALSELADKKKQFILPIQTGFAQAGNWKLFSDNVPKALSDSSAVCSAAASSGQLEFLKDLSTHYKQSDWLRTVVGAAENGHTNVLEWLGQTDPWIIKSDYATAAAAKTGQIGVLEYLKDISYFGGSTFDSACKYGQIKVLDWLKKNDRLRSIHSYWEVFRTNNIEVIQWSIINKPRQWTSAETASVARIGDLDSLKLCVEHNCPWDFQTCVTAARSGFFDMLKWAVANGCPLHAKVCEAAARGGHFDILMWLRENGCDMDITTAATAAETGRKDIIQWAIETQGLAWAKEICDGAALGGHIDLIKWLLEQGCPWDDTVCQKASGGGHLQTLMWCVENGRTMNVSRCLYAASSCGTYKKDIVQWIVSLHTVDYSNVAPPPTEADITEFFSSIDL